jgi:hypothetical protein
VEGGWHCDPDISGQGPSRRGASDVQHCRRSTVNLPRTLRPVAEEIKHSRWENEPGRLQLGVAVMCDDDGVSESTACGRCLEMDGCASDF